MTTTASLDTMDTVYDENVFKMSEALKVLSEGIIRLPQLSLPSILGRFESLAKQHVQEFSRMTSDVLDRLGETRREFSERLDGITKHFDERLNLLEEIPSSVEERRRDRRLDRMDECLVSLANAHSTERLDRIEESLARSVDRLDRIEECLSRSIERTDQVNESLGRVEKQLASIWSHLNISRLSFRHCFVVL